MKIEILIPEAYGLFELSVDRRGPFMLETPPRRLLKAFRLSLTTPVFEILVNRKPIYQNFMCSLIVCLSYNVADIVA